MGGVLGTEASRSTLLLTFTGVMICCFSFFLVEVIISNRVVPSTEQITYKRSQVYPEIRKRGEREEGKGNRKRES
jgi:hypothetical protein